MHFSIRIATLKMNLKEDPDEDYSEHYHIYKNKGKKFWNKNVRERRQQPSTTTSNAFTVTLEAGKEAADNRIVQRKITEIVKLREKEFRCLRFTPSSFLVSLAHKEEHIYKELAPMGYYQADRCQGLTFKEAKLVLIKLAEVHADYLLYRRGPIKATYKANRICKVPDVSKHIANGAIMAAKMYLPNFERLAHKVQKKVAEFDPQMQYVFEGGWRDDDIIVINHGDAWLNNFIFKQENGILKDAILLKSQLPRYGSLALDLNFFLHTSLQVEVLKGHRKELIRFYHKSLCQIMLSSMLQVEPTSYYAISEEVGRCEFYSFYTVMCELPLVCLERDQCDNLLLSNFSDKIFVKKICNTFFQCSRVLETLQYTLERLDKLGVLG